jgi:hypothetical protein
MQLCEIVLPDYSVLAHSALSSMHAFLRAHSEVARPVSYAMRASTLWVSSSSRGEELLSTTIDVATIAEGGGEGLCTSRRDDQHHIKKHSQQLPMSARDLLGCRRTQVDSSHRPHPAGWWRLAGATGTLALGGASHGCRPLPSHSEG